MNEWERQELLNLYKEHLDLKRDMLSASMFMVSVGSLPMRF